VSSVLVRASSVLSFATFSRWRIISAFNPTHRCGVIWFGLKKVVTMPVSCPCHWAVFKNRFATSFVHSVSRNSRNALPYSLCNMPISFARLIVATSSAEMLRRLLPIAVWAA
jgi:hypothetical protein